MFKWELTIHSQFIKQIKEVLLCIYLQFIKMFFDFQSFPGAILLLSQNLKRCVDILSPSSTLPLPLQPTSLCTSLLSFIKTAALGNVLQDLHGAKFNGTLPFLSYLTSPWLWHNHVLFLSLEVFSPPVSVESLSPSFLPIFLIIFFHLFCSLSYLYVLCFLWVSLGSAFHLSL